MGPEIVLLLAVILFIVVIYSKLFSKIVVYEFQKGLLYRKGTFVKLLGAGRYRFLKANTDIQVVDIRRALLSMPGQEILTKDNIGLKLSLCGFFEVTDPVKAKHQSQNYLNEFYNHAQIALRDVISAYTMDELLEKKGDIDAQLLSKVTDKAAALGLAVTSLAVKDIMLPANLKKAFSGILEARKEAQKQLEKARGEQAVLRNLANSSAMLEGNPMLLQARIIQSLSTGNNTVIFNAPDNDVIIPKKSAG
ncbi:MAG: slipin family protein [Alphaproteobacteria bacterium]|nr:MAG: slipin family protein [Alphaproteobacteria bacterium]